MAIIAFSVGSRLEMKKPHPCGNYNFEVLKTGTDIRIRCLECGREVSVPRLKLEKNIKKVISEDSKTK